MKDIFFPIICPICQDTLIIATKGRACRNKITPFESNFPHYEIMVDVWELTNQDIRYREYTTSSKYRTVYDSYNDITNIQVFNGQEPPRVIYMFGNWDFLEPFSGRIFPDENREMFIQNLILLS